MTTMETSGPDAPILDPKPQVAAQEKKQGEKETELNGHNAAGLSKSEPQPESKTESASEPEIVDEKQTDAVHELIKTDADRGVVNGTSSSEAQPSLNGADTDMKEATDPSSNTQDDVKPASDDGLGKPSPETAEPPSNESESLQDKEITKGSDAITKLDSTAVNMEAAPENEAPEFNKVEESAEQPSEEPSKKLTQEDIDMVDSPAEKPNQTRPTASKPIMADESAITSQDVAALPTSQVDLGPASMSQLNLETTEKSSSPTEGAADVFMTDAPSSSKVVRERDEEDADDEPAHKRARTEPKEDEPTAPTPAEVQSEATVSGTEILGLNNSTLSTLSNWSDEETNRRPISTFQRREMRKIIGRVKKTKAGGHFRDSVQKLWPALWDSYIARVTRPMDLAELERGLRDPNGPYNTYGDFRKDLSLVFENALDFNGPVHAVTGSAATAVKAVWEEVLPIPSEEPVKLKSMPKPKPARESRAVAHIDTVARRQSAGPAASPTADAAVGKAAAATQDQSAVDRRSSTATEGDRPKRTVRAPKPKDIDYTTKPSRKKLKPELQFAEEVLVELMAGKNHHINEWFMDPVDAEGLNIPTYYSIIKKPMDLNKVSRMLSGGELSNIKEFEKTVRLIFENCYKFNGPVHQGNPVSAIAKQLEDFFVAQMKGKDAWLAKHAKANAPASGSNASDEDEDEDDEDGEDAEVIVDSKEIEELQAKLDEETKKLNSMLLTSNQSMIDIQKNIVDMVQKTLISKAQEAQAARAKAKSDKPKKSGKSGKAKAGAASGRKVTAGQTKKAGGSKKAAPKKSLTVAQKDQIANGINDLEYPHLDRAIDIIKKDTGQNENNDGELELDIDQLSHDALSKLWDLCRKALPGFAKDTEPIAAPESGRQAAKHSSKASTAAKPKKNKPMSASEQEQRIAELQALSQMYRNPQDPGDGVGVTQAPTPGAESSDDSDSEEE